MQFVVNLLILHLCTPMIGSDISGQLDATTAIESQKSNILHMTRCDYDAVFYRVFCVTLLAIAFTFTVILTNVFIDIDGLLASKTDKHNGRMNENKDIVRDEFTSEAVASDNDDINYGENDDSYRNKRSVETQSFLFHIKNPKIKSILANRLSTLLEELDAEESTNQPKQKNINKEPPIEVPKDVELVDLPKLTEEERKKKSDDMLHITMHNILLQGIIGHMDLNDVYRKLHSMMDHFNELRDKKDGRKSLRRNEILKTQHEDSKLLPKPIEEKIFEEMVNCNELREEIAHSITRKDSENTKKPSPVKASPNIMVKTIIDITSIGNDKAKENDTKNSKENIKGVVELVYNGKLIKFTRPDVDMIQKPKIKPITTIVKPIEIKKVTSETTTETVINDYKAIPKSDLDKFVDEYFKHFPHENKEVSAEVRENFETKRLKRNIKMSSFENSHEKKKSKTEDDELYVEIETHFDSKGMKGEKKKKLIRSLIEKIQKAIHSDMDGKLIPKGQDKKKPDNKRKQIHFRKRLQNPLDYKNHVLINKYSVPLSSIVHRQLNPISKTVPMQESSPYIGGRSGEEWKKPCFGPGFLAASKAINSAEMSEVDVDYKKVMDVNGIPQRLQMPLNTEMSDETLNTNSYYDLGKMKFFIKDIDGSGFSVGFNQYVDEPPDADTMRLFSGLENVIKTYHQNYDPAEVGTTTEANFNIEERAIDSSSPNNEHMIVRRSVNRKRDYHSNEYKIIYDSNYLPFKDYRDIFETRKSLKTNIEFSSKKHLNELPLIVDENIFEKNLKPSEIFGLANLFERKKRSINVKKISSLKSKIKLNRYLNTKAMATKRIFLNKKRNKRQINKIRIIATDIPHLSKHSDENVFVVSDENVFADRAIVKEVETSEGDHDKQEETEYIPYSSDDSFPQTYVTKIFDGRSRHNPLMSKYPHIFMEEISRSREEYIPDNALLFGKIPGFGKIPSFGKSTSNGSADDKSDDKVVLDEFSAAPVVVPNVTESSKLQKEQEIVNALMAPPSKSNYKVTVKISPKNMTGLNSGFKEIHTSINKRFNKNGLLYSSLVNVSEISKVVKLNRSKDEIYKGGDNTLARKIREQQEKMQLLLKAHAKHINEQLSRLNEEKINIESMLDGDNVTDFRYLDYDDLFMSSKSSKRQSSAEAKTEKKMQTTTDSPKTTTEPAATTILTTTSTPMPTKPHCENTTLFTDKVKNNIITTIERNGNLTDRILRKIDKNTEMLQTFLMKLTEKIQVPTVTSTSKPEPKEDEAKVTKLDMNSFMPEWKNNGGLQFHQNMVIRKNDSHITIPFMYTYQQSMHPNKDKAPLANIVYHGHIHSNTLQPKDHKTSEDKEKIKILHTPEINNQSRFFIDELENDYKVIQVGDLKKNRDYNMVSGNATIP